MEGSVCGNRDWVRNLTIPSVFSKALIEGSQAFVLYFCNLRSETYRFFKLKSISANATPINLTTSSCLLGLGPNRKDTWRLDGEEVAGRWVSMETKGCLCGLICRCTTKEPIFRWAVELDLARHPLGPSQFTGLRFDCVTNLSTESDSQSVKIGDSDDYLDVYHLTVTPTLPKVASDAVGVPKGPAKPYVLRAVGPHPVDPSDLLCVSHRGMGAETPENRRWPENTLGSFHKAAEMNVPMVELDVIPLRDSSDFVLYHNFNIVTKECIRGKLPCGCPRHVIDLFDNPGICNKYMPNLIPTFSKSELDDLKWGKHLNTCENPVREKIDSRTEYAPLFSRFLSTIPPTLSADIELKYPHETPYSSFKLINDGKATEKSLGGFGNPSRYFYSLNLFADNLLRALEDFGKGRRVILSSFNADLCLALRLKQTSFPVVFISRAGIHYPDSTEPPHNLDPRHRDAFAAADWAALVCLTGVVIRGDPLMVESGHGEELVKYLADRHLACIPFGVEVSEAAFLERAASLGITGVCIDDVEKNAWIPLNRE